MVADHLLAAERLGGLEPAAHSIREGMPLIGLRIQKPRQLVVSGEAEHGVDPQQRDDFVADQSTHHPFLPGGEPLFEVRRVGG